MNPLTAGEIRAVKERDMIRKTVLGAALALFAASAAFVVTEAQAATTSAAVLKHYAELAHAKYEDR